MERFLFYALVIYLFFMNLLSFILMFVDKRRAKNGAWRISERTLMLTALLGGSIGSFIGMQLFRHKTRHLLFRAGIPLIFILQLVLCILVFSNVSNALTGPAAVTRQQLDLYVHSDSRSATQLLKPLLDQEAGSSDEETNPDEEQLLMETAHLFYEPFSYEITSTDISSQTAEVAVLITLYDTRSMAKDLCLALTKARINARDTLHPHDILQLLNSTLTSHTYEVQTQSTTFTLQKSNNAWLLPEDDTWLQALSGRLSEYVHDPDILEPVQVLELYLEYYEALDAQAWENLLNADDLFATGSLALAEEANLCYCRQLAEKLTCSISTAAWEYEPAAADSTTLSVSVTSIDMPAVMRQYREQLVAYAGTAASITADSDELNDTAATLLADCIRDSSDIMTQETAVSMYHDGNSWYPEISSEFTNLLMGDMEGALTILRGDI